MNNKYNIIVSILLLLLSFTAYSTSTKITMNQNSSVDSIIRSLQREIVGLKQQTKQLIKEQNKNNNTNIAPTFEMYDNVVVRHNAE